MEKAVSLSQIGLYNPQRQSAELTEKLFVVRQKQFEALMERLNDEMPDSIPQHHLILAQRGMGKTTILKRIEVELHKEQYHDKFIPVLFTEEQYGLNNLAKFWENSLNALANSLEAEDKENPVIVEIDNYLEQITKEKHTDNLSEKLYQYLLTLCKKLKRRPVLLVDNIGIVFSRLSKQEQHILRAYISEKSCPVIVSAGVAMAGDSDAKEHIIDYKAPFYDFFQIHYLRKLNFPEFEELLQNLAKITQTNITITSKESPRLKSLLQLTGGNPRTSVILFKLLVKGFTADIVDDLEALTDEMTPLYKARFEALSTQQQQILYAISLNWDFISLKKIHEDTGLDNNQLSPQLKRLIDDGWLETTKAYEAKGNAYSISERFFSIWNQMRNGNRKQKEQINCLSKFVECFFGEERIIQEAERFLCQKEVIDKKDLKIMLAIIESKYAKNHKEKLEEIRNNAILELSKNNIEILEEFEIHSKYMKNTGKLVNVLNNFSTDKFISLINKLEFNDFTWREIGTSFIMDKEDYEKAIVCFAKCIVLDTYSWFWKGICLYEMRQYEKSLVCFDKSIELNPEKDETEYDWHMKGKCFYEIQQYEKAIVCFNKSIKLDSEEKDNWFWKGECLLSLEQYKEAIKCCNKAIKLNPNYQVAWANKGYALMEMGHYKEAALAYEKSNSMYPQDLLPKFYLLYLYRDKLGKMKEATELFNTIDENEISKNEDKKQVARYYIHKSAFELYKHNEGLATEYLLQSFEILERDGKIQSIASDYCWKKFASVVIQLGYGFWLLSTLEDKGYDIVLSPYYVAIKVLVIERTENTEIAEIYLRNQAIEKSEPARMIIEKMRKYI